MIFRKLIGTALQEQTQSSATFPLADAIWDESGEPLEKRKRVSKPNKPNGEGINSAVKLAFPNPADEQIEGGHK